MIEIYSASLQIYSVMEGRKEGRILFNDVLNTFYLWIYGVKTYGKGLLRHIKEPLLLIGKSSLCGGSGFSLSLSEWSLTICLMPYNHK